MLHESILEEWPIWRLVHAKIATLEELSTVYTLDDCLKMNAILDYYAHTEAAMYEEADRKAKK